VDSSPESRADVERRLCRECSGWPWFTIGLASGGQGDAGDDIKAIEAPFACCCSHLAGPGVARRVVENISLVELS
jgi:hypothetical protein